MAWVKLDDLFPQHPKIVRLSDAAYRLHVDALCYCSNQLTDGYVPQGFTRGRPAKAVKELLVELWEPTEEGYLIHDYLAYNPSRKEVLDKKKKDAERKGIHFDSARNPNGKKAESLRIRDRKEVWNP